MDIERNNLDAQHRRRPIEDKVHLPDRERHGAAIPLILEGEAELHPEDVASPLCVASEQEQAVEAWGRELAAQQIGNLGVFCGPCAPGVRGARGGGRFGRGSRALAATMARQGRAKGATRVGVGMVRSSS